MQQANKAEKIATMTLRDQGSIQHIISLLGIGNEIPSPADASTGAWIDVIRDHSYDVIRMGKQENKKLFCYPVRVVITDAPIVEACALTRESQDIIVITKGLLHKLRRTICFLLADPRALMGVGDASLEDEQYANSPYADMPIPRCPVRQKAVTDIMLKACHFVLLHELGHLFYGHPEFVARFSDSKGFFEFGMAETKNSPVTGSVRHALEFQADRYAADVALVLGFGSLWEGPFGFVFTDPRSESDVEHSLAVSLEENTISNWAIAMNLVFHLLASVSAGDSAHPHPNWRYMAALMSALTTFTSTHRVHSQGEKPIIRTNPKRFLDLCNDIRGQVADAWQYTGYDLFKDIIMSEQEFRSVFHKAVLMLGELNHRFDASRIP